MLPMVKVALVVAPLVTPTPLMSCAALPPAKICPAPMTLARRLKLSPLPLLALV